MDIFSNAKVKEHSDFKVRKILRAVAFVTALIFFWDQIVFAAGTLPFEQSPTEPAQATLDVPTADPKIPTPKSISIKNNPPVFTSTEFLSSTLTLTPSQMQSASKNTEALSDFNYEYERYSFEDALDLFRPEFATAVIVKDLKEEDLKELVNLEMEVGILVLHGEIVLFTSGNEDEIGVSTAVGALIEKASLISHTHPSTHQIAGPSAYDLSHAEGTEYVIAVEGIYVYDKTTVSSVSYEEYLKVLHKAASEVPGGQVEVRQDLNVFIAAQDAYNNLNEKEVFRRATPEPTVQYVYDSAGNVIRMITTNYYDDGKIKTKDDARYINGVQTYLYQTSFDSEGIKTHYIATEYHPDGQTVKMVTDFYYTDGIFAGYNRSIYDALGVKTRDYNTTYYLNTATVETVEDIQYVDGVRTCTYQHFFNSEVVKTRYISTEYYSNGETVVEDVRYVDGIPTYAYKNFYDSEAVKTRYILTEYYPDGQTTKMVTDSYYTDGIPAGYNRSTYDALGVKTRDYNVMYYSNGTTVKAIDDIRYVENVRNYSYQTFYDSEGLKTHYLVTAYHPDGQAIQTFTDYYYTEGILASYNQSIYDAAGVRTRDVNVTYYSDGNMQQMDDIRYVDGVRVSLYQYFNDSEGARIRYVSTTYHSGGEAVNEVSDSRYTSGVKSDYYYSNYDASGAKVRDYNVTYYPDTTMAEMAEDIRYVDGVRTCSYKNFYSSEGIKTRYIAINYQADGETISSTDDMWFADTIKTQRYYATYNDSGSRTHLLMQAFYPDGKLKTSDDYDYVETKLTERVFREYDASGLELQSLTESYPLRVVTTNDHYVIRYTVDGASYEETVSLTEGSNLLQRTINGYDDTPVLLEWDITLDTILPVIVIDPATPIWINTPSLTINYTVDGIAQSKTFADLAEGENTLSIVGTDQVGNQTTVTWKVTVDTTAPTGSITINDGAASTTSRDVVLTLTAGDVAAGIDQMSFSFDNGTSWTAWEPFSALKSLSLVGGSGEKVIQCRVKDTTGLTSSVFSDSIMLSINPPAIEFASSQNSEAQEYILAYTVDGELKTETWHLGNGVNRFIVRASNSEGLETVKTYAVTWEAPQVSEPILYDFTEESMVSVTGQSGFVFKYLNGNLVSIEKPEEYTFHSLEFDADNKLTGGLLVYLTGSQVYYKNDQFVWEQDPQGTRYYFNSDGSLREIVTRDNNKTVFLYEKDPQGETLFINAASDTVTASYTAEGKLLTTLNPSGDITNYNNGILESVRLANGSIIAYKRTELPSGIKIELMSSEAPQDYPASVVYDGEGSVTEVLQQSGTRILFQNGVPSQIIDLDGVTNDYNFDINSLGDFLSFDVSRLGYTQKFDGAGNLQSIVTPEGETFFISGASITGLQLLDGTTVRDFSLNETGDKISSGTITSADGVESVYENSRIVQMTTPEGLVYAFTYDEQGNATALLSNANGAGSDVFSKLVYDKDMNLVSAQSLGDELLHFIGQRVAQIDIPGDSPITFEYATDPLDPQSLIQVIATQGEIQITYDGQGHITHSTVYLTEDGDGVLDISYQYDRIREIKKDGVLFSTYAYEFDSLGNEIAVVTEIESKIVRRYQESKLISMTQPDGMTTQYLYGSDGKVSKSIVSWKGRTQSEFTYSYDGDITYILDEEGITQGFDVDGKLVRILQGGDVYAVHQLPAGGAEATAQELVQRTLSDGLVIHYQMGKVIRIEYPDGTRVEDVIEDSNGNLFSAKIYHPNGSVERIVNGKKVEIVRPDATILEYEDGKLVGVKNALGVVLPISEIEASLQSLASLDYSQLATTLSQTDENQDLNKGKIIAYADDLITVEMPDGKKLEYKSGKLSKETDPGTHETIEYSYDGDDVIVSESGSKKYFDADGNLFKYVDFKGNIFTVTANLTDEAISSYQLVSADLSVNLDLDGILVSVQNTDPSVEAVQTQFFNFRYKLGGISLQLQDLSLQATVLITEDGDQRLRLVESGTVDQFNGDTISVQKDGITYEYQLGQLMKLTQSNGDEVLYGKEGGLITVTEGGTTYYYDVQGILKKYSVRDSEDLHTWEIDSITKTYTRHTLEDSDGLVYDEYYDSEGRVIYEKVREEVENGGLGADLTPVGDVHIEDQSPLTDGDFSASFDGSGDYLSFANDPSFDFGTGDFTVEAWVWLDSVTGDQYVVSLDNGDNNTSLRLSDGKFEFIGSTNGVLRWRMIGTTAIQPGCWYHVVGIRSVNTFKLFVNGVQEGSEAIYAGSTVIDPQVFIGVEDAGHSNFVKGQIDEVRVSNIARWTSDFPPPTTEYTEDANTSLLLHFEKYRYATKTTVYPRSIDQLPLTLDTSILNLNTRSPFTGPMTIKETGYGYEWFQNPSAMVSDEITPFTLKRLSGDFQAGQMASDDVMYSVFDAQDKLISTVQKNGIYTTYEQGKVRQIWDKAGVLLVEYVYDADGIVISVSYPQARKELEEKMAVARLQVEIVKIQALLDLAAQENIAIQQIETEYNNAIAQLQSQRAQLESQRYQKVCRQTMCWTTCETVEVPGVAAAIGQVNNAISQTIQDREAALVNVSEQVTQAKADIEAQIAATFAELDQNEKQGKENIQRQEITPVVFAWYRKILGRDPSLTEYDYWIAQTPYETEFNLQALKDSLLTSDEFVSRTQSVDQIKANVRDALNSYYAMSDTDKLVVQDRLGIRGEAVVLSRDELDQMIAWINSQGLHFGQSAYLSLEAMLDDAHIAYTREDLATDLILTDILTGILSPYDAGDLVISLYALQNKAASCGLEVVNASFDYSSLLALEKDTSGNLTKRLVAHVNKNHFIIVTKVEDDQITYIDPGMGADHQNQVMTATKGEFIAMWSGNVMLAKPVYDFLQAMPQPPPAAHLLTTEESMRVRGAFFGAIFNFLKDIFVGAFNLVVDLLTYSYHQIINFFTLQFDDFFKDTKTDLQRVVTDLVDIANASVNLTGEILGIIPFIGKPVSCFYKKVATYVIDGAEVTFRAMIQALPDNLQEAIKFIQDPIGSTVQVVCAGMQAGFAYTLTEAFGVSPEKAQKIASITTGAVKVVVGAVLFATTGNTTVMAQGFYQVTTELGVPPAIASAIAIVGSALISGSIDGDPSTTIFQALKNSTPQIAGAFAQAGVVALGGTLGLDPRITGLLSIPVSAAVTAGVGYFTTPRMIPLGLDEFGAMQYAPDTRSFLQYIGDAILSPSNVAGMVSIGASIGLDAIGAPTVLQSFLPGLIGQIVAGGAGGDEPSADEQGQSIFSRIWNNVQKFGQEITQLVGGAVSFGADILQRGYDAVKNTFSALFSREAQEVLYETSVSGSAGLGAGWVLSSRTENYDANDNLTSVVEVYTNTAGDRVTMVGGVQTGNFTIQRQMANGDWYQEVYEGLTRGVSGGISFNNAALAQTLNGETGQTLHQIYEKDYLKEVNLTDANNQQLFRISGPVGLGVEIAADGTLWNGVLDYLNIHAQIKDGQMQQVQESEMIWSKTFEGADGEQETVVWIKPGEWIRTDVAEPFYQTYIPQGWNNFVQEMQELGARTLEYGSGLVLSYIHQAGDTVAAEINQFVSAAQTASRQLGLNPLEYYAISDLEPTITLNPELGVGKVDMPLQWISLANGFQTPIYGLYDIKFFTTAFLTEAALKGFDVALQEAASGKLDVPPNWRWRKACDAAAVRIGEIVVQRTVDFLTVPGVNSQGLTIEEEKLVKDMLDIPEGKMVVWAHSAGTDATIESLKYMTDEAKKNLVVIFGSPRMDPVLFNQKLAESGLSPSQVIVIGASGDMPHTPLENMDKVITDLMQGKVPITNGQVDVAKIIDLIEIMTASGFKPAEIYKELTVRGYNWIKPEERQYQYVFLKRDVSSLSNPLMGHGACAPEAVVAGHVYEADVNDTEEPDSHTLGDILKKLIERMDDNNG